MTNLEHGKEYEEPASSYEQMHYDPFTQRPTPPATPLIPTRGSWWGSDIPDGIFPPDKQVFNDVKLRVHHLRRVRAYRSYYIGLACLYCLALLIVSVLIFDFLALVFTFLHL